MDNLINITLNFITESTDINWFFSTMATASTAFIILIITVAIQNSSAISQDIHNKTDELYKQELEVHNLKLKRDRNEKKLTQLINAFQPNQDEYRHYAKLIMETNGNILYLEQRINEIKKILKYNIEKIEYIKLLTLKRIYVFSLIFIVLPLFLLSLPHNKSILIGLNIIKILLLIILVVFIHKFINDFKKIIASDSIDLDTILKW